MNSIELVKSTILGTNTGGRTPLYAWTWDNVTDKLKAGFGSVQAFEDAYEFDLAMLFGGPYPFFTAEILAAKRSGEELTPDILLQLPYTDPDNEAAYEMLRRQLKHYREERQRFCYVQTPGIFEALNDPLGIENHLCYMLLYPEEMEQLYRRQVEWNKKFIRNVTDLGVDMIHISDDWGAQNNLLFSPDTWRSMIYPYHREMVETVHAKGALASLHSDGNIMSVLDGIADIGYDLIHPFQESAGMSYQTYLERYAEQFGIMGGLCIQTTLGFGDYARLEREIRRVFSLLKHKRWVCCTTHLVQPHCSLEELVFALDLVKTLR